MKRQYAVYSIILLFCFVFFCACQNSEGTSEKEDTKDVSQHQARVVDGYEELRYEMPEGLDTIVPYATKMNDDIGFMLLGIKDEVYYVWTSDDNGKTWNEPIEVPEELRGIVTEGGNTDGQRSIMSACISEKGVFAFIRATYSENNNYTCDYWTWKPGEAERKLDIQLEMDEFYINQTRTHESVSIKPNAFTKWKYLDTGELLAEAMNGQVCLINPENGEIKTWTAYVQGMKRIEYTQVIDGKILVQTADGIFSYLADTGEFVETDTMLQSDITELSSLGEYTYVGNAYEIFEYNGNLYEVGKNGIHMRNGETKEKVLTGEDTLIGNRMLRFLNAFCKEEGFLIPCVENGQYYTAYYRYTGGDNTTKQGKLKNFSLRENDNLAQAVELYKSLNSQIKVQLEIGLSEEGSISVPDAIRNLSTRIMAGDGPDVILLDEMAVNTYIEKGILTDITDIYAEVDKKEGLLRNVAGAYTKEEKLYAIPTHFYVPILLGQGRDIESIENLESLEAAIKGINQRGEKALADKDMRGLLNYCTAISSAAWIKDGELQEERLEVFLESVKSMCQTENLEEGTYNVDNHIQDFRDDYLQPIFYASGVNQLSMGLAKGFSDISQIESASHEREGSTWKRHNGQAKNVFVPSAIIGVSGRATNKEEAFAFVKFLLSAEMQRNEVGSGFPVNIKALEQLAEEEPKKEEWSIMRALRNGQIMEFTVKPSSQGSVKEFCAQLKSVDSPKLTDTMVLQTVNEYALSYIKNEITLERAIEAIKSRVDLHLAE